MVMTVTRDLSKQISKVGCGARALPFLAASVTKAKPKNKQPKHHVAEVSVCFLESEACERMGIKLASHSTGFFPRRRSARPGRKPLFTRLITGSNFQALWLIFFHQDSQMYCELSGEILCVSVERCVLRVHILYVSISI